MASSTRTVNVKFDGDAKGLARATKDGEREVDKFTKSVDKKFRDNGDGASKSFASRFSGGMKKWFKGDGDGLFKEIGKNSGTVFGSGILGALKTPILGPAILAAVGVTVATVMPAVGAIAGTGLVAGFGAGLVGLGVVFAAKSESVKAAWSKTLGEMGADMQVLSRPFEKTLIDMAGVAKRTFAVFKPELASAFKDLAPVVSSFVDSLGRGFEKLAPAIKPISAAFQAVLQSLGPAMQQAIGSISSGLQKLAESVRKNPRALADLVKGAGDLFGVLVTGISALNDINGAFERLPGGVSLVTRLMNTFTFFTKAAIAPIVLAAAGLEALGLKAKKAGIDTGQFQKELFSVVDTIRGGIPVTEGGSKAVETLAQKFDRQWQATQRANQELFRNSGLLLTLSGASINYQEAVDRATESVKQNGKTHDLNTEKGRNNQRALDDLARSANEQTEAMVNSGKGNSAAAGAAEQARKAYEKQAVQMGYTKEEAKRMAAEFVKIPKKTQADFKGDITDLDAKIKDAKTKLADPKLSATKRAKLEAEIAQLLAAKKKAQEAINSLQGKTVPVTVRYSTVGLTKAIEASTRGGGKRASGGPVQPNRSYLVGERGPEILTMGPTGSRIMNAEQTTQALTQSAQPIVVENHIEIGGEVVRVVRSEIRSDKRSLKRTVGAR